MALIILLVSVAAATAFCLETFGVWGRFAGAVAGKGASGYSVHVRFATAGRFSNFLIPPLLGYLVDAYQSALVIAVAASVGGGLSVIGALFIQQPVSQYVMRSLGYDGKTSFLSPERLTEEDSNCVRGILITGVASYAIILLGVFAANLLAATFVDYRSTFSQVATAITGFGTLLHVFMVDVKLTKMCDQSIETAYAATLAYINARMIAAGTCFIFWISVSAILKTGFFES